MQSSCGSKALLRSQVPRAAGVHASAQAAPFLPFFRFLSTLVSPLQPPRAAQTVPWETLPPALLLAGSGSSSCTGRPARSRDWRRDHCLPRLDYRLLICLCLGQCFWPSSRGSMNVFRLKCI